MKYKNLLPILILFILHLACIGQVHKLVRIYDYKSMPYQAADLGIDVIQMESDWIDALVEESELLSLSTYFMDYEIIHQNYDAHIASLLGKMNYLPDQIQNEDNFRLGSYAGFYTLNEIYGEFDRIMAQYPEYFNEYIIIGKTYEKQNIYAYSFGSNDENKPAILLTSLHHAREPGSVLPIIYFLWKLFERAEAGDAEIIYLLNNRRIHVIPVINPDGYLYNQSLFPKGGGLWRKNRKKINDSTYGVDLNRNYGPIEFWNASVGSSSTNPRDITYRGSEPFSEAETNAIREYCNNHRVDIALNFHTYSNVLIHPYSSIGRETPDSLLYRYLAKSLTDTNLYLFGLDSATVLYHARGSSDDWMHQTIDKSYSIIAFTPEVGTVNDNFWLPTFSGTARSDRLYHLAKSNFEMILTALRSADWNLTIFDAAIINPDNDRIAIVINNIGCEKSPENLILRVSTNEPLITIQDSIIALEAINSGALITFYSDLTYKSGIINGSEIEFKFDIEGAAYKKSFTKKIKFYEPVIIDLFVQAGDTSLWSLGRWGAQKLADGSHAFTDTPYRSYDTNSSYTATLSQAINFSGYSSAELEFQAKWNIDPNYDVAFLQYSIDYGTSWNYLKFHRMTQGIGIKGSQHDTLMPAFTGSYPIWTRFEADLSDLMGNEVLFKWTLKSGASINYDGIFIKDMKLRLYDNSVNINEIDETINIVTLTVQKGNPIKLSVDSLEKVGLTYQVFDLSGKLVRSGLCDIVDKFCIISSDNLNKGLYIIRLNSFGSLHFFKAIIY